MAKDHNTSAPDILAYAGVLSKVGLSKSTVQRAVKAGTFPAPIRLSARRVGFRRSDIEAWLANGGLA